MRQRAVRARRPVRRRLPGGRAAPPASNGAGPAEAGAVPAGPRPVAVVPPEPAATRSWLLPLAVLTIGTFMSILDTSIVNVAIPTIQNQFGATADQVQAVSTAYTLTLAVVVPVSAWLGDRYGLDRIYQLALLGFVAGSALSGLAWNLDVLVGFRVVQAIGGGVLPVVALAMLYRIAPRDRIGAATGLYGLGVVVAPAIGPTLGGYLTEFVTWRLIFYINVPIGILGALAAYRALPGFPRKAGRRFDAAGFLTVSIGLFTLLLALSQGQDWGWTSYAILLLFALAGFSLALFVVIELSVAEPLLDLRVFRQWSFTNSLLLLGLLSVGLFTTLFYVPLFLQEDQGLGALEVGLILLPGALVTAVVVPLAGPLYDRIGPRWPAVGGLGIVAYATYLLHDLGTDTPTRLVVLWTSLRSFGFGLAMIPILTGGLAVIPTEQVSQASAINNVVQRVSSSLGLALLTALVTGLSAQQLADRAALLPAVEPGFAQLGAVAARGQLGIVSLYNATQAQAFAGAIDDVFLLIAGLTALSALLALGLRSGRSGRRARPADPTSSEGDAPWLARGRPGRRPPRRL